MSTAAQHYEAAEQCLDMAADIESNFMSNLAPEQHADEDQAAAVVTARAALLSEAQVHATLALVAVQADHTAVVAAGSTTVRGVVDIRSVVHRNAFAVPPRTKRASADAP